MHPILFKLGPLKVYSYGLAVALAFIISTYLAKLEARREGIDPEKILNLSLGLAISGVFGARILYVLQNLKFYFKNPCQILMLHKGGLSFYGGFILAAVFVTIFLKRLRLPVFKTFDVICPYLALAQAIGRIGCFLNGCCYGKATTSFFAVYFPGQDIARHPVQIYSSLTLLAIFIILKISRTKKAKANYFFGQTFLLYCSLYSISRFFMEYLRGDNLRILANLTIHQFISIGIFIITLVVWWERWNNFSSKLQLKIKA